MTGHQENPGTGHSLQGQPTPQVEIEPLVRGLGVQRVHAVDAYDLKGVDAAFKDALAHEEPAVIITRRECALLPEARKRYRPIRVDRSKCIACWTCFRIGCPIDPLMCTGCEVCAQVCPQNAILFRAQLDAEEK